MRALVLAALLASANAEALHGSFDPAPLRNRAVITFVNTPVPNIECAKHVAPILAPVVLATAFGCVSRDYKRLIAAFTPSPFWAHIVAHGLATPHQVIGHELRHFFEGDFHPLLLPSYDRLRDDTQRRLLLDSQHGGTVFPGGRHDEDGERLSREADDCTIYVRAESVSYDDLGRMAAECAKP